MKILSLRLIAILLSISLVAFPDVAHAITWIITEPATVPSQPTALFQEEALAARLTSRFSDITSSRPHLLMTRSRRRIERDHPRSLLRRVWDVMKWSVIFRISLERLHFRALRLVWSEPQLNVPEDLLEPENRPETWDRALPVSTRMLRTLYAHHIPDKLPMVLDPERSKRSLLATVDRDPKGRPYYFYDFNHFASKTLGDNRPDTLRSFMDHLFEVVNRHAYSDFVTQAYYDFLMMMMSIAPEGLNHILLVNSGAEANENALKATKLLRGEKAQFVVSFGKSFHGRTAMTASATDKIKVYGGFFRFEWPKVPYPVLKGTSETDSQEAEKESLKRLWAIIATGQKNDPQPASYVEFYRLYNEIDRYLMMRAAGTAPDPAAFTSDLRAQLSSETLENARKTAAVMIEGFQGEGGIRFASARFYQRLRMLTYIYDVPLILDEIQSGMYITGKTWAHEQYNLPIPPDIVTAAKKAQMGVVYFNDKYHVREMGKLNSTWGGSEGGMVRGVSYQEVMKQEGIGQQINILGAYILSKLEAMQSKLQAEIAPDVVSGARGRGLALALDFKSEAERDYVMERALRRGLILNAAGGSDNPILRIFPRYDTPTYDIDVMIDILTEAIRDSVRRGGPMFPSKPIAPLEPGTPSLPYQLELFKRSA